ncbi:MAG: hypothetical protein SFT93_01510 [Rickettsiaceae bacterium]|nr:hypothetical protein [Rickettsiaceae bacterium]
MTKMEAGMTEKRRGNDKKETGMTIMVSSPRKRGSRKHVIHSKEGIQ